MNEHWRRELESLRKNLKTLVSQLDLEMTVMNKFITDGLKMHDEMIQMLVVMKDELTTGALDVLLTDDEKTKINSQIFGIKAALVRSKEERLKLIQDYAELNKTYFNLNLQKR